MINIPKIKNLALEKPLDDQDFMKPLLKSEVFYDNRDKYRISPKAIQKLVDHLGITHGTDISLP